MNKTNYTTPLILLTILFFMWGFVTALNDILIPYLKGLFEFTNAQAQIVNLAFFGAYFVFALPASWLIKKFHHQRSIVMALIVIGLGCFLFYPAAEYASFNFFLLALFIIASGITILQVAANPFVTALGSPEKASSRLNLAQGFNSFGTILGPYFGSLVLLKGVEEVSEATGEDVQMPYILLGISLFVIAILFAFAKLPKLKIDTTKSSKSLKDFPHLIFGMIAIFFYVGAEVAIGSNIVFFLAEDNIAGLAEKQAGFYVSVYWASAMVGRFIGAALQTRYSPAKVLMFAALIAGILVLFGAFGSGSLAMYSILAIGFFNSVMFATIFSLSVNGLGDYTNTGSGLLIMAIVGGALIPPIMGYFSADTDGKMTNLQLSFLVPLVSYIYILFYSIRGYNIGLQKSKP